MDLSFSPHLMQLSLSLLRTHTRTHFYAHRHSNKYLFSRTTFFSSRLTKKLELFTITTFKCAKQCSKILRLLFYEQLLSFKRVDPVQTHLLPVLVCKWEWLAVTGANRVGPDVEECSSRKCYKIRKSHRPLRQNVFLYKKLLTYL